MSDRFALSVLLWWMLSCLTLFTALKASIGSFLRCGPLGRINYSDDPDEKELLRGTIRLPLPELILILYRCAVWECWLGLWLCEKFRHTKLRFFLPFSGRPDPQVDAGGSGAQAEDSPIDRGLKGYLKSADRTRVGWTHGNHEPLRFNTITDYGTPPATAFGSLLKNNRDDFCRQKFLPRPIWISPWRNSRQKQRGDTIDGHSKATSSALLWRVDWNNDSKVGHIQFGRVYPHQNFFLNFSLRLERSGMCIECDVNILFRVRATKVTAHKTVSDLRRIKRMERNSNE